MTLPELVKVPSLPNSISKKAELPEVAPAKILPLTALVMLLPPRISTSTSLNTVACAAIVLLLVTLLPIDTKKFRYPSSLIPTSRPC